ncbi:MAG: prealbumin-like fold domain-containing protein, partial [Anaerococcus sp.]|nr:prealbumin-like fold domain-containing protein [Anaerococcus sp.]
DLTDQLGGKLGISDSKHHDLNENAKTLVYTFYTPRVNKQASYMIDVSTILKNKKNKVGALRHILKEGYPQEKIEQNSPNRTSMNNRTTIKGELKSESTGQWTITDAVSTGDTNNGLPLETRSLENQTLATGKRAVYGINKETGKMEVKNPETNISNVPEKEVNPKGTQAVGNIGVYKFDTKLNTPNDPTDYSVGGVTISKYKDIIVDQHWSLADGYDKMPAQNLTVKDNNGVELGKKELKEEDGHQRVITVPNVRFWNIASDGKASMIDHKVDQTLPTEIISVSDKKYTFKENANYYDIDSKSHQIVNALIEKNDKIPATFTVIKVDANNPEKRIPGANFYLLGAEISITTDANGEATFNNVKPGTYTLKETKAPAGYKLDQEDKTITISDDGKVSISGKNAQFSSGSGKTDILEHSDFPNWKDFMNTQHYGKVDENGNLKFYVYLKPYDQRVGGRTDKDTTFNISIPGVNLQDSNIKVYDVSPNKRPDIFASMNNQNVDQKLSSLGKITLGAPNNNGAIEGNANTKNPLSGNNSYQITFPQRRFGDNWGFLVEVNANIGDKDSTVLTYDWLSKEAPAGQSKIRANVNLSKNSDENGHPTITISNEELPKSEIEVAKFADTSTDGSKDRLGGAEFVLKNKNGEIIANKVTGEDGKVSFGKYPTGTYYLEEVKAPEGYEKSNVYFRVTVSEDGQVSYDAKFKDSSGSPTAGVDYYIEREEGGQTEDTAIVTRVNQSMVINDDEGSGNFRGVWEAYRLESLKYHLDATISNAAPGSRFEIQFDPNLDFTQYFKTFPNIEFKGKMIAEPYFNYKTNLLTYVFNENSLSNGLTTFSLDLKGMIPSKFYATHSGNWDFTNIVAPNQSSGTIQGNPVENIKVHADYDGYDKHTTPGKFPSQAYYFRDVYKADDGNWYVKAIGYYNPLGDYKTGNANKIWFNWKFANYQGVKQETWQGQYDPPYYLDDVKIYETTIPPLKKYEAHRDYYPQVNDYMPLSMGVRPEQN